MLGGFDLVMPVISMVSMKIFGANLSAVSTNSAWRNDVTEPDAPVHDVLFRDTVPASGVGVRRLAAMCSSRQLQLSVDVVFRTVGGGVNPSWVGMGINFERDALPVIQDLDVDRVVTITELD